MNRPIDPNDSAERDGPPDPVLPGHSSHGVDARELAAGRRRATTAVAWLVLLLGAGPLYGVLYQILPDLVPRDRGPGATAQRTTGTQPAEPTGTAPSAGVATGVAASAPIVRQSTDFMPKEATWSRVLRESGDDAVKRGNAIATNGNGAGAVACVSCHAVAPGQATPAGAFPRLVGMTADYLAKQLFDYRDDRRVDPVMGPIAKALKDDEIAAVARYYAGQPAPTVTLAQGGESRAEKLHALGDNGRALPACANCHGVAGEGQGFLLPRLTGQPADYLTKQFDAFRNGTRHNDDDGVMRGIAQRLAPEDARALSVFYAGGGGQ